MKTESESIEAIISRRLVLFTGYVVSMEDTGLPKCVMYEGGRRIRGGGGGGGGQQK